MSGALSDATTGPLQAGVVYHAVGNLSVPAGATLTAQAGAVVKFQTPGAVFQVLGTLNAQGSAARPVVFTEIHDDSVGGDSAGDGPTVGAPGYWKGLFFGPPSDASSLSRTIVRYGGNNFYAVVTLDQADVALSNCTIERGYAAGLDLGSSALAPQVHGCTLRDNGGVAIDNVPLQALPGLVDDTVVGNGGNYARITVGSSAVDLNLQAQNCPGGALVMAVSLNVLAGRALTLGPGVVVKFWPGGLLGMVDGTLSVAGSSAAPVVFTVLTDDEYGGDTNGDGPSNGVPGAWRGLLLRPTADASQLTYATVRYGGNNFFAGVTLDQADAALSNCTIERGYAAGLDLGSSALAPQVHGCTLRDNGGVAIDNVPLQALPGLVDDTVAGNGGNYARITVGSSAVDLNLQAQNCPGGALVMAVSLNVLAGRALTLGPGVVVKFWPGGLLGMVDGTLSVAGSSAAPVVFTVLTDDEYGGDTNGDGPSTGAPGAWRGLLLRPTADASQLTYATVRYGGNNFFAGVTLDQADAALSNCTIERGYAAGLDLGSSALAPQVHGCTLRDNGAWAIDNVPLDALPGFALNGASGNAVNALRVTVAVPSHDLSVPAAACLEGSLVLPGALSVPTGVRLTLQPGVVLKFASSAGQVVVDGALDAPGTASQPVVLTCFADDAFGGDSNGDGSASLPAAGSWRGVWVKPTASSASWSEMRVRYAGASFLPAALLEASGLAVRRLNAEHAYANGIQASAHAGTAEGWLAWDCGSVGISLWGGAFGLRQASAVANGVGVQATGTWSGAVSDSIAWNNSTSNFAGLPAGHLLHSDGDPSAAGTQGNLYVDPSFVDAAHGVFELALGSPCIDAGDPASPSDPDGTRADMGALPYDQCAPVFYCTPKLTSSGCWPQLVASGRPSASAGAGFVLSTTQVDPGNVGLFLYSKSGPAALPFQGGLLCVKAPFLRSPAMHAAGSAACLASFGMDFNAFIASGSDPALVAGTVVHLQAWFRDPPDPVSGTGLSGGVAFRVCP